VLYHRQRAQGLAFKDRLIANLPRWAPRASHVPWLANLRDTLPGGARLSEGWFGLSARRTLPRWRSDTFLRNGAASPRDGGSARADLVLFVDTFTNYFEPENARAALAVLRAAGRSVVVARANAAGGDAARPLCCGRTYLSAGLVDEAKAEARRTAAALAPHVERGAAIVGLEPSCLLSMRDEFLVMGLGDPAKRLAGTAFLIEEYLMRERRAGRLDLPLRALEAKRALLHTHCHQKAFDAAASVREVLALIPGLAVDHIESSCCGMAGSFGYEAQHYDISVAMAEQALMPAVRAAAPDTLIVADGTSCRHQIADLSRTGVARQPIHAIRVLERALGTTD
jgi:Fe-S oxidoreductase